MKVDELPVSSVGFCVTAANDWRNDESAVRPSDIVCRLDISETLSPA